MSGDITASEFKLNLTSTEANEVLTEYALEVYPISQSWAEGSGQFFDNPVTKIGCSWERRDDNTLWNVSSAQVFNGSVLGTTPTKGVVLYEGFTDGSGSAFLTESINDFNGNSPFALVDNNKLIISASNFAGTTLIFPYTF